MSTRRICASTGFDQGRRIKCASRDNLRFSLGIDVLGNQSWAMNFIYDRQISDRWSTDSFFAKVMFEL